MAAILILLLAPPAISFAPDVPPPSTGNVQRRDVLNNFGMIVAASIFAPTSDALAAETKVYSSSTCDRSAFIKTSLASIAAITTLSPTIAFADNDDLSMPSAEEQKAADVSCTQYG